jgi:hypothetical protein
MATEQQVVHEDNDAQTSAVDGDDYAPPSGTGGGTPEDNSFSFHNAFKGVGDTLVL